MSAFVLGIDGGGTRTRAAFVAEDGRLLGVAVSGPSNIDDVGVNAAQQSVLNAVERAAQMAGIDRSECRGAFLGMAGIVSAQDRAHVRGIAVRLDLAPHDRIGVNHDCSIALAGGLSGRPGIVQIAGTGSSCYGSNAAGDECLVGGRGYLISDEGSSYWLGVQAMRMAVMADDGRLTPSPIVHEVMDHLGIAHMDEILHRVYVEGLSRSEVAAMAPVVVTLAKQGDAVCNSLLEQGATDLVCCIEAAARRLSFSGPFELCTVGGLIERDGPFADVFGRLLAERIPHATKVRAELPPVLGAAVLALRLAGMGADEPVLQEMQRQRDEVIG